MTWYKLMDLLMGPAGTMALTQHLVVHKSLSLIQS